ncbi:D site albumin promoter binding protein a [Hippocampus zosterae]|uniref:D site albumin promoter binding protein a n=1 Tax=Hippocampus zosterae TaxID=109293 RepID=UPI00223E8A54|nr:D site albumin promoter binding protein a [Hippocampus zosterae]XP_051927185.1 D site albumin promoter binding protein a [Hippocampus zosterae]
MSRPLAQLLPPSELPGGAGAQFGAPNGTSTGPPGGHLTSMNNLKSLLQLPIKADQRGSKDCCEIKDKDKPLDSDEDTLGLGVGSGPGALGGGGLGSGALRPNSQSAFLGPLLWERTLPCDGGLFQLQYMDLEEFLTENGMGMHGNGPSSAGAQIPSQSSQSAVPSQSSQCPPGSPSPCSSSSSMSSSSSSSSLLGLENVQAPPPQQQGLMGAPECLHGGQVAAQDASPTSSGPPGSAGASTATPGGGDIQVNFDPDPADVALSSVPGQEAFDPRRHRFSDEELKPQPMIKKARKMLVPNEQKDEKYWSRRVKNNEAAKRSRDARRLKENQISVRAAFLERENAALRLEVADMRKELGRCRNIINKYESRHGDL